MKKIIELQLSNLKNRLKAQNIDLSWDNKVVEKLIQMSYDPSYGARPVRRVLQKYVQDLIATYILEGRIKEEHFETKLRLAYNNDVLEVII